MLVVPAIRGVREATRFATALSALAASLAFASTASAGPYIAVEGGVAIHGDSDVSLSSPANSVFAGNESGTSPFNVGFVVGGAVGWRISDFRAELAASYSANPLDRLKLGAVDASVPGGIQVVGAMANAYWDIPFRDRVRPYVGAGIGLAHVTYETNTSRQGGGFYLDNTDTQFAGNVMAGVGVGLTDRITLDLGYRFLVSRDITLQSEDMAGFTVSTLDISVQRHDIKLGLRYEF